MKKTDLLLGAAAFLLLAAPGLAEAQHAPANVTNTQFQTAPTTATVDVTTENAPVITTTGFGVGNTVSVIVSGTNATLQNQQETEGAVTIDNTVRAGTVENAAIAVTNGMGNAATARSTGGSIDGTSTQVTGAATLRGRTTLDLGYALSGTASTQIVGNAIEVSAENGDVAFGSYQASGGSVYSTTDVDAGSTAYGLTGVATAVGNSFKSAGRTTTSTTEVQQVTTGAVVQGSTDIYATEAANVTAASQAAGNTATVLNDFGYGQMVSDQSNSSYVRSESYVTLDTWFGAATSSAYGVGNSAMLHTESADGAIYADQVNEGSGVIDVNASLTGSSEDPHGVGIVNATAIGNSIAGSVSNSTGLIANGYQTNTAAVTATATGRVGHSGVITGSASAIGNAASYTVNNGH